MAHDAMTKRKEVKSANELRGHRKRRYEDSLELDILGNKHAKKCHIKHAIR